MLFYPGVRERSKAAVITLIEGAYLNGLTDWAFFESKPREFIWFGLLIE